MRRYAWLFLGLLPLLAGCPKREQTPDYDAVRQRADQSQQSLDREQNKTP